MTEILLDEFRMEAKTTRRHLERLPADKLAWRPHEKSFTAGGLASHIVDCLGWVEDIFRTDGVDMDPATYKPYRAVSTADLLATFDRRVQAALAAMASATDEGLLAPWRLRMRGQLRFEKPRTSVFRDFTLSHMIHHRGQLSLYLRLLNQPVPGSYGPTADERG